MRKTTIALIAFASLTTMITAQAAERCHLYIKSVPTATTIGSRTNIPYKNVSFKECFQIASEEIKSRKEGDSLMIKHTSRAGVVKVFKMEKSTPEDFEQYSIY